MDTVKKIFADPWNFAIGAGVVLLLFIGITLLLFRVAPSGGDRAREPENAPNESKPQDSNTGPEATIIDEKNFEGITVRYTDAGFSPDRIVFSARDAKLSGCILKIQNDSSGDLLLRLGPPQEKDNKGFGYSPIPPGESGLIDPRYSGIFEEEFYNRKKTAHRFSASLNAPCFE